MGIAGIEFTDVVFSKQNMRIGMNMAIPTTASPVVPIEEENTPNASKCRVFLPGDTTTTPFLADSRKLDSDSRDRADMMEDICGFVHI